MKNTKSRKVLIWVIIGLIIAAGIGYSANWLYKKNAASRRVAAIERKIADYQKKYEENPEDAKLIMDYARFLHDYDNLERLQKSLELFKKAQELMPDDPEAIGYYGSALTKMANHVESIPDKVEYLQAGLDVMDNNVRDHPDSFEARMVRAENNYYIPTMFNRINVSIKDFEYMLQMTESGQYTSMIPYLKLRLGQSYILAERPADAKRVLQELIAEYPTGKIAERAQETLKTLN